jgi:DNA-binding response OmpR family regulator
MKEQKILIVDDDSDLRSALQTALTNAGFTTFIAENGSEGLALALLHKPDLILLDISMPHMNGHQTLSELRKDSWGKDVQVFFLTNLDDPKNIVQGFEQKSDDYIIKSNTSLEAIVKKVKQYLAGYRE